ncbi:hydrolase, carbon-nitrogen family protein [Emericellopsis atlantica]|uniref:Hydrolase, carbon-nitrogen family protein n=1 Tax=Emericellopsis atlantica TaxID=2614577 RepID=A0A9P7ZPM1_9HYPO|nr:hydrolase, carbon-nitrogen family protein [Emericellopsis atlantica]KAG9255378.1 hydrolase, carbon-nitrogen family protein [Emericellopsis atlantica]
MRIGCLQFAPQVGDLNNNLNRADAVLNRADPEDLDLLVLPELAFSGYNFKNLRDISPFLEPSGSGISSLWARTIALKYDCTVIAGYPEKVDPSSKWPTGPEYYNSAIIVNGDGETIGNYRKTHLYRTDETWALENPEGFYKGFIPGLGHTAIGICMDLNPCQFKAPWHAFEFAFHVLEHQSNLVVLSMAWMTAQDGRSFSRMPQEPDVETLMYWVTRLEPLIRAEEDEEIIVVFANRSGIEDDAIYAGTSAVLGIKDGEVVVYGILGRGDKDLLVVDTDEAPYARLVYRPFGADLESATEQSHANGVKSRNDGVASNGSHTTINPKGPGNVISDYGTGTSETGSLSAPSTQSNLSESSGSSTKAQTSRSSKSRAKPRKKLSLQTDEATLNANNVDAPMIQTPTGPSPTPIAVRPRLTIPPADSITHKYLTENYQDPNAGNAKSSQALCVTTQALPVHKLTPHPMVNNAGGDGAIKIFGGEVSIVREGSESGASSAREPVSHFSPLSASSSNLYWMPPGRLLDTPLPNRGWTPAAASDATVFSDASPIVSRSNATSALSNRYPKSSPHTALPHANGQTFAEGFANASRQLQKARESSKSAQGLESVPRPASPKSRNASRSRGPERPGSELDSNTNLNAIALKLDEIAQRVDSAQSQRREQRSQSVHGDNGHIVVSDAQNLRDANASRQSIPITACATLWDRTRELKYESSQHDHKSLAANEASGSGHGTQTPESIARGRHERRPISRAGLHSANGTPNRRVSRGRQPENPTGGTPSKQGRSSATSSGNRRRKSSSTNPVDLSQFRLIEEYRSPNCPVHGAHAAAQGADRVNSTGSATVTQPPFGSPPIRRVHTTDPSMLSLNDTARAPLEPLAQIDGSDGAVVVATEVRSTAASSATSSGSPYSLFEPSTPQAMTWIFEDLNSAPLDDVHKQVAQVAEVALSRPRSALW